MAGWRGLFISSKIARRVYDPGDGFTSYPTHKGRGSGTQLLKAVLEKMRLG